MVLAKQLKNFTKLFWLIFMPLQLNAVGQPLINTLSPLDFPFFDNDRYLQPAEICTRTGIQGSMTSLGNICPALNRAMQSGTVEEIKPGLQACISSNAGVAVWLLLNHPDLKVQKAAHEFQTQNMTQALIQFTRRSPTPEPAPPSPTPTETPIDVIAELEAGSRTAPEYTKGSLQKTRTFLTNMKKNTSWDGQMMKAREQIPLLCAVYRVPRCEEAMGWILEVMHPRMYHGTMFSLLDLWDEFLTDPQFVRGANLAALTILQRIQAMERGQRPTGDFYGDLLRSYLSTGVSAERAFELTWKFLAIYSTRGASHQQLKYFLNPENDRLGIALMVISSGMSYLDGLTANTQHPYSYPREIKTTCHLGRPYHFWMPAYFAYALHQHRFEWQTAWLASYLSGIGYEFQSHTFGREPTVVFFNPLFDDYNNGIRANLAFTIAGARYGSQLFSSEDPFPAREMDLDRALVRLMEGAIPFPPYSEAEMRKRIEDPKEQILLWMLRFRPNLNIPFFL